jgi:hypothetical protein
METLERTFEIVSDGISAVARGLERGITSLFGSSNARYIRRLMPRVQVISAREPQYQQMTDAELREQTDKFRKRLEAGETLDDLLIDAFAVCREAGRRVLGMRHFDVQLMGGMVLHSRLDRGNGHRRRQDPGGHAAGLSQRPGGQGRPRGHGERLPRPPRHGMDGPALHVAGVDGRHDPEQHAQLRAAAGLLLRHHLRHQQRVRLRLSPRQHAAGRPGRQQLSAGVPAGAGAAALRRHRRGGQHPHRRGPHAADHLRPGPRRRQPLPPGRPHRPAAEKGRALRGQREGALLPPDRRAAFAGRSSWPAWRASTRPATWNGRT